VIQTRALAEGTGSTGGYLVPQGFYTQIVETLKTFGTLLNVATVLHTPLGNALPIPTMDDTSNEGVIVPENGSIPELGATFGQKTLGAYKFSSNIVRVSYELLNDSASVVLPQVNDGYSTGAASGVEGIINDISGERIGRIMDHKYTVGAGTTEPMGIVNAVTAFTTGATGQTTSIIYDNLIDLQYSVDKAYRNAAGWMLNDLSIAAIRKLKDTQGHPLWQPALTAGAPDLLLGYPVQTNNYVPVMAANAVSVLFGDFRRYYIRIVDQVIAQRLTERYADFGQVGFLILMRADGNLMDTSAVKAYKNSAT
jgi:HK97 family phage major capsid protein